MGTKLDTEQISSKDPPPESEGNEVSPQQLAAEPPAGETKDESTARAGQADVSRKAIDCRSCLKLWWSLKSIANGVQYIYDIDTEIYL